MPGGIGGGTVVAEVVRAESGASDLGGTIDGGGGGRGPCMPNTQQTTASLYTLAIMLRTTFVALSS